MNDLTDRALVTLEEARRYVFRSEQGDGRDNLLIDAVNMVSDAILDHIGREVTPTDDVARTFELDQSGFVDLRPFELRSVNANGILIHPDRTVAEQLTPTTDEYRLFPIGGSEEGTYLWLQLEKPVLSQLSYGFGWQVQITGDWGLAELPRSLKLAALQWVKNVVENPGAYASHTMSGYTVVPEPDLVPVGGGGAAGMPAAVRHRLRPFRRQVLLV